MFDIQEELKKLPAKPGVYLMHNSKDEIIYVGKAIKLCNRVRQYFQSSYNKSIKIQHMVSHIAYFEYIITDSELEALVLECNLIKEHRPHYNTMLKDDKAYPYIKVTVNEDFPRILFSHQMKKDKAKRAAEAAAQEQIQKQPEPAEEKKSMSIAQRAHLADGLDNENGDDTDAQESSVSLEKKPEDEKSE